MKKTVTKQEQQYINSLLKKRREREMDKILSVNQSRERLWVYDKENHIYNDGNKSMDVEIEKYRILSNEKL